MKRKSLLVSALSLTIVLGLGMGCARKPDDVKISSDIQSKFNQDSGLSGKQLKVQASNGVVTLAGTVENDAQRDAASRQAASVAGVKEVVNNLQVGTSGLVASASSPTDSATSRASHAPPAIDKPTLGKKHGKFRNSESQKPRESPDPDSSQMNGGDQGSSQTVAPVNPPAIAVQPPPPPAPKKLIIDQGTQLTVRLIDPIDSEKNQTGETFRATLNAPLTSDGEQAVPAGVEVTGHLVEVKSAGKFAGQSTVALQLDSFASGGKTYSVQTDQYRKSGSSRGKNTAEKVGGGALICGIIGAIAGGGKGAGIGAAAGAGVGGGVQAATKGQQIKLPSETVLNFTLQAPITVVQTAPPGANRPKLGDSQ
jgi:hypothetical protein